MELRLPHTALVVVPRGGTPAEEGDVLTVLADEKGVSEVRAMVGAETPAS